MCLEFVVLKFVGKFFCTYVLLNYHRFVVFVLTNTQMHLGSDWEHFLKTNQLQWRIMLSRVTWKISSSKQSKCWLDLYILWEKQYCSIGDVPFHWNNLFYHMDAGINIWLVAFSFPQEFYTVWVRYSRIKYTRITRCLGVIQIKPMWGKTTLTSWTDKLVDIIIKWSLGQHMCVIDQE